LGGSLQREKPAERRGVPSHDRRGVDEPSPCLADPDLAAIAPDEFLGNDPGRNEDMKINASYWRSRFGILLIGLLSILGGVKDIVSKHTGGGIRDQYFGTSAIVAGVVFVAAGVICLIVGFRNKPPTESPKR
jgi:hypothetical protein